MNCIKGNSLFSQSLSPLLYCFECSNKGLPSWTRNGRNVVYFLNDQEGKSENSNKVNHYIASFIVQLHNHSETCQYRIAYCYPYTYTNLLILLKKITVDTFFSQNCIVSKIATTTDGFTCPLLTITDFRDKDENKKKPVIVLTGRVHPGETPGSWVMQGIIELLLSKIEVAYRLRSMYIFKIVPMLNPDGVINGMSR